MQRWLPLLLLGTLFFSGCRPREDTQLYIYCTETFWYVMQEEALFFNKTHDFQIILIPIRAERTSEIIEDVVEIGAERLAPSPWRSMPVREEERVEEEEEDIPAPFSQIHPDIVRQIERIGEERFGDLFLSDSPRHLDQVRDTALAANDFLVCYLTLSMLVPMGNPHQFRTVKDVLDSNRRLGIMNPSFDGLGEASWQVLKKTVSGGEPAIPMDRIQIFERQYDLLDALEQENIDAALVWNATSQTSFLLLKYANDALTAHEREIRRAERRHDRARVQFIIQTIYRDIIETMRFAEEVPLTENPDERHVVAIRLVALSSTFDYGHCKRFADFMRSNQGKEVLQRYGFVVE